MPDLFIQAHARARAAADGRTAAVAPPAARGEDGVLPGWAADVLFELQCWNIAAPGDIAALNRSFAENAAALCLLARARPDLADELARRAEERHAPPAPAMPAAAAVSSMPPATTAVNSMPPVAAAGPRPAARGPARDRRRGGIVPSHLGRQRSFL